MQFKITIITGILLLLISSLSIANPVSQTETPPQKTKQTQKKKPNFIQKIILKKIKKKVAKNNKSNEPASSLAKASLTLGIIPYVLLLLTPITSLFFLIGLLSAIAAIATGAIVRDNSKPKSISDKFGKAGYWLGIIYVLGAIALFIWAITFTLHYVLNSLSS